MADSSKESNERRVLSRRKLLGGAAAGVAAGAVGSFSSITKAWGAPAVPKGAVQEMTADVVVAGAGIGGLTAAVRSLHQGASVILLEKAEQPGGTTAHSEGGLANHEYEHMRNNSPDGDPVVQRAIYDNIERFFGFMEEIDAPITRPGEPAAMVGAQQISDGERRGRVIPPVVWVRYMVGELEDRGGTLLTETPMTRIMTNDRREVVGVLAEGPDGPVRIRTKAVVVATGGWAHNAKMVNEHITREQIWQRNVSNGRETPLFTGDGYFLASQLGAAPSKGGWDAFYGYSLPARPGRPVEPMANVSIYHAHFGVGLNLYGRRYADESGGKWGSRPRDQFTGRSAQILNQEGCRQVEASTIHIWDEVINRERACAECALGGSDRWLAYREVGAPVAQADTLSELADQIERWGRGTPAQTIMEEVTQYNQAAEAGRAWALPIPKTGAENGHANPLTTGPFYAVLGTAAITATYGGLRADSQGRVLDRFDRPIRGLFAAGVDIGGYSTYAYLGNLLIGGSFGYLSGTNAPRVPEPSGGWAVAPWMGASVPT